VFQWLVTNRNSNSEFLSEKGLVIAYSSRDSGFGFQKNNPSLIEERYSVFFKQESPQGEEPQSILKQLNCPIRI